MSKRSHQSMGNMLDGYGFVEIQLISESLTQASLNGTSTARAGGMFSAAVVATYTQSAGGASRIRLILEGTNDGTTWFVVSQSPQTNLATTTGDVIALADDTGGVVPVGRYRLLRVRAVVVTDGGGLTFTLACRVTAFVFSAGTSNAQNSATLTRTSATVSDTAFTRIGGSQFATVQAVMAAINLGGASSFSVRLQGSPDDGTTWITIASQAFTANTSLLLEQDGSSLINLSGYNDFRFQVADVGGAGTAFTVNVYMQVDSADVQAGFISANLGVINPDLFAQCFLYVAVNTATDVTAENAGGGVGANQRGVTFRLMRWDGTPYAMARRVKVVAYDTPGAPADLSTNGVVANVYGGVGTALFGAGTTAMTALTSTQGTLQVLIQDVAVETIYTTILNDDVIQTAGRAIIVQTTEVTLAFA